MEFNFTVKTSVNKYVKTTMIISQLLFQAVKPHKLIIKNFSELLCP